MLATRFDITYSLYLMAIYMKKPIEVHMAATRRTLIYLKGTMNLGVLYKRSDELVLQGGQVQIMLEIVMT